MNGTGEYTHTGTGPITGDIYNPSYADCQSEIVRLREQLEAAKADIPRKCLTCAKRKGWETCKEAKLISDGEECLNWVWRGMKEEDKKDG